MKIGYWPSHIATIGIAGIMAIVIGGNSVYAHDNCQSPTIQSDPSLSNWDEYSLEADYSELQTLTQSQVLLPAQSGLETRFGHDNKLKGDTLAVRSRNLFGERHGTVDIFEYKNNEWQYIKTLKSPSQQVAESFGIIAFSGDTLFISAVNYCEAGPCDGGGQGTVYVFERNEGGQNNWGFIQQLDGGYKTGAHFGITTDADGDTAVIRSREELQSSINSAAVYIFERGADETGKWGLVKRIESTDSWHISRDYFGTGVFIQGDTLLVNGHNSYGLVMKEFGRDIGGKNNWGFVQEISIPGNEAYTADFDGKTLLHIVDSCLPSEEPTKRLLFYGKDDEGVWRQHQEIISEANFRQVVVDDDLALVATEDGTAGYVLQQGASPDSWEFIARLIYSDGPADRDNPNGPSLDSGRAVIGLPYSNNEEGMALLYDLSMFDVFNINPGLNDAWYDPETDGQGFFITAFPDLNYVSLAWFTYDTELPAEDALANLGDPGHRWLTAGGPIDGNQALMNIEMTSGGIFDTASEIIRTDPPGSDGTIILTFDNCNSGTIEYDIPAINRQGIVPIRRVANDNIVICEALSTD